MSTPLFRTLSLKKPTVDRCFGVLAFVFTSTAIASAQQVGAPVSLTEQEVLARALQRAPLNEVLEGVVAIEEGRGRAASAYPNPQISYVREQTFGSLGTGEDYLSVAQVIDLGNRRGLQGDAGDARASAAQEEGHAVRVRVAAETRLRFYELLYRQERVAALETFVVHLDEALATMRSRERGGDVATYDRRRLEREQAVAAGRLETDRAALERVRAQLAALLAIRTDDANLQVAGTLLPDGEPAALETLRASLGSRPELLALDLRLEAAALERRAAARGWVPDLRLEAGWKGINFEGPGRSDGFLIGASLSIPLSDRSSGLARIADGETQVTRGRRALLELELDGEMAGVRAEAVRLRRAASAFREQTTAASSDLVRIALAGYTGGELSLLELLDAYRGAADDSLSALDMELAARRARIELDRLTGAGPP